MIRRWLSLLLRRPQPRHTVWVLQVPESWSETPACWTGTGQSFSTDLRKAVQFTGREDAEQVLAEQGALQAEAVEVETDGD